MSEGTGDNEGGFRQMIGERGNGPVCLPLGFILGGLRQFVSAMPYSPNGL